MSIETTAVDDPQAIVPNEAEQALLDKTWSLLSDRMRDQRWSNGVRDEAWYFLFSMVCHRGENPDQDHAAIEEHRSALDKTQRRHSNRRIRIPVSAIVCKVLVHASCITPGSANSHDYPFKHENWYPTVLALVKNPDFDLDLI